ncbi:hypothetical protein OIO90_000189 [Microbotryomycetes sp. JL221]|nr:hypothetical protein OIO90_000189 [Microbotryomycetes sp. JL221]
MSDVPTTLADTAQARKQKLLALRKRKQLHDSGAPATADGATGDPAPNGQDDEAFRFRNYDPETGQARKHARTQEQDTVEHQVDGMAERVLEQDQLTRAQELDLTNIQPKRANWDLKRDLDRKLAKLKPKTDLAISQLIRTRLQAQKQSSKQGEQTMPEGAAELVAAVGAAGNGLAAEDSDEDEDAV